MGRQYARGAHSQTAVPRSATGGRSYLHLYNETSTLAPRGISDTSRKEEMWKRRSSRTACLFYQHQPPSC
ncbi:hypothetical protein GN956_G7116 [Arapaima gigas]